MLSKIIQIVSAIPVAIVAIQKIVGGGNGGIKQMHVETIVMESINVAELVSRKDIVDEKEFKKGVKMVIDGIVKIVKSTMWGRESGF